jgi:hypothetical protein
MSMFRNETRPEIIFASEFRAPPLSLQGIGRLISNNRGGITGFFQLALPAESALTNKMECEGDGLPVAGLTTLGILGSILALWLAKEPELRFTFPVLNKTILQSMRSVIPVY